MPAPNPTRELIKRELEDRVPQGNFQERYQLVENFKRRPCLTGTREPSTVNQAAVQLLQSLNDDFDIAGTGAADAGQLLNIDGGALIASGATDNNFTVVSPAAALNSIEKTAWRIVEWHAQEELIFDCVIELTQIALTLGHFGLKLTANTVIGTDDDAAFFQWSPEGATSTTNWTCCTSIDGTDVEADSGIAGVLGESVWLRITTNANRIARFYINGTKVYTSTALAASKLLLPVLGIQCLEAAAKTFKVRHLALSRKYNAF